MKLEAIKDGKGNIVITEHSFDFLLSCLDNQKFIQGAPQNQSIIDDYNNQCRKILHQHYVFETCEDDYFLYKKYQLQDDIIPWSGDDVAKVYELFKDTKIIYEKPKNLRPLTNDTPIMENTITIGVDENGWIVCEPEDRPWLIERTLRYDYQYLTISEDGHKNRPWKKLEIENINRIFNGYLIEKNNFYKEELWKEQLSKMDINIIEQYIRNLKLKKL